VLQAFFIIMKKILTILTALVSLFLSAQVFQVDKVKSSIYLITTATLRQSAELVYDEFYEELSVSDINELQESSIPFFDRWVVNKYDSDLDDFSDYLVFANLGAGLFLSYDEPYTWENLIVLSEVILTQSALASWSKTLSQRLRAYVYDQETSLKMKQAEDAAQSFFSHHTSTVFSLATYSYYYSYHRNGADPILAAGLFGSAAICAGLRVASASHFPSDVITGAVVGSGVSYLICRQHTKKQKLNFSFSWKQIGLSYNF